ncbi:MAG: hypothetical protein HY741_29730 [Chloroflexi bacterium]|nr:hypothetical protein [Chloroflexota bacterium]
MSFTISDISDLKRLLIEHPEWRAELRALILTDELVALPRAFAEARASYEARFERIERALAQLTERVDELAQTVGQLAQAQARTESSLQRLIERVDRIADKQGLMLGKLLEREYADHAAAYFTDYLKRVRVVFPAQSFDDTTEEILYERLSPAQRRQVTRLDVLARAKLITAREPTSPDLWVAIEVSSVIDRSDVERVQERAAMLREAGLRVIPVVAGQDITLGAKEMLEQAPVLLLLDGKSEGWERALDAALRD